MRGAALRSVRRAALLAVALALTGCGSRHVLPVVPNQRPVVHLTSAPTSSSSPYFYVYEIRWTGFDADGHVERYLYAVDPPEGPDTAWVSTTANRVTLSLRSGDPDSLGTPGQPGGFHVFVIRAVDDRGAYSVPLVRAFYSFTVAPTVSIVQPRPSHLLTIYLPPAAFVRWSGSDPDGRQSQKPVKYKYRLFSFDDPAFPMDVAVAHPDSFRRFFAPAFAGWDSSTTDTAASFTGLTPGSDYLFAVVAFDEAGAYSPVFSLDDNMLRFHVEITSMLGPRFTVQSEFFDYTYPSGGFDPDPDHHPHVDVPYQHPLAISWSAVPTPGATTLRFRWALDIERLDDETPRTDESADLRHWSRWLRFATAAVVGPFGAAPGEPQDHRFYVEAEDDNGSVSLAMVSIHVVAPAFTRDLLFVKDTRFILDSNYPGRDSLLAPGGAWPSEAELDTFFYARGGVHWKYYPPGTLSRPGIFNGYSFDTLSTRRLRNGSVPLALLAQYRHVVWFTDPAILYLQPPYYPRYPMPGLRWICGPNSANTLAVYAGMGGQVWLLGGGAAYNSLVPWDVGSNNAGTTVFSHAAGELVSGRLMYDVGHWRSEITELFARELARSPSATGGWPGAPFYAALPPTLAVRSPQTDPLPPLRGSGTFYRSDMEVEYLSRPNRVVEDLDPNPEAEDLRPALDTLYVTALGAAPPELPIMTLYHGDENGRFVFSGFPLWGLQRAQAMALGDFVLHEVWGLARQPLPR